ncbi:MAG: glucose 1-dehydrogenase [Chloroflexi bacterium]|nr:glucose 1-dehydrogenase [Chloroflexota bacterium]
MSSKLFDLTGKVVIITGAGKGIGRSLARGMAEAGADIVAAARTEADIQGTAGEVRALGRKSLAVPTDVRLSEQIGNLFTKTMQEFGRVDILVNNAGGSFLTKSLEVSENAWNAILRENLTSAFLCSQEAARIMIKQGGGSIVNLASVSGLRANTVSIAYGAAKAGVTSLTQTLAADLGPHGIRVNAVAPGHIVTEGVAHFMKTDAGTAARLGAHEKASPLRRLGKPEDIVGAVIFLAAEASAYVTGQTLVVDGGLTSTLD